MTLAPPEADGFETCRSPRCAARVMWVLMAPGMKPVPLDPDPDPFGSIMLTGTIADNGLPVAQTVSVAARFGRRLRQRHRASCPDPGAWSGKGPLRSYR